MMNLRVVLDTNVLISAGLKQNSFPSLAVRWMEQSGGLLKSKETEHEALAVLQRPRISSKIAPDFVSQVIRLLSNAELVQIRDSVAACRDPKDDKFLALAVNGHADILVSGDADLLALDTFCEVPILTPAAFCRALAL